MDATTGQNGLAQAKVFHQHIGVTDIILTKLDGTAKGGVVIAIIEQLKLPIAFIGVGEQLDDLIPFQAESFVNGLLDI
jgi:fused signal recognition particle receptor